VVACYASARSLQHGEAVPVIALTGTAANVANVADGFVVFGDPIPADRLALIVLMLGIAKICVAALLTPAPLRVAPAVTSTPWPGDDYLGRLTIRGRTRCR
jgi:hypothetical protein